MPLVLRIPLLLFIIFLFADTGYAQQLQEDDSVQILQYVKKLNRDLIRDILGEDTSFTDEIIDSVRMEHRRGYYGGHVYYAPDSVFKIYIIDGNGGGAYDNSMFGSFLHFKNGKRLDLGDLLTPITGIYKTGAQTYIAIQHVWSRSAAVHTENNYTLTQFSVDKDSIKYIPIVFTDKQPLYYSDNFTIYTLNFYERTAETYMRFDPKIKRLSYRFMLGYHQAESFREHLLPLYKNEDQVLLITGSCVVKKGLLQFAGEKFKAVDWEDKD